MRWESCLDTQSAGVLRAVFDGLTSYLIYLILSSYSCLSRSCARPRDRRPAADRSERIDAPEHFSAGNIAGVFGDARTTIHESELFL